MTIKEKVESNALYSESSINKTDNIQKNLQKKTLYENAEYLESLDADKNDWIFALSHELRTPLNVILSTIQVVQQNIKNNQDGEYSRVKTRYLDIMKQNCYRLLKMVNNLIEINKVESVFFNIDLKNEDIVHIVRDMTISVTEYAKIKNIDLTFKSNQKKHIMAVDIFQLERIMLNLLSNAIKFTPVDGSIKVILTVEDDEIFISVSDTGPGIPEEYGNMIFERYCQTGGKSLLEKKGSGMGLYLVKKLLDKMNGRIWFCNNEDKGTTLTFSLPNLKLSQGSAAEESPSTEYIKSRTEYLEIEFSDIYVI
ncbi:MAG: HAMP domain-containing histidine kinase [Clostridiaceae bacterium]|nr:HAMP domain-containing histidine kinase [Clostridiaceae bacterium]